jgi:hypothetical protein
VPAATPLPTDGLAYHGGPINNVRRTSSGALVFNTFPIRYYEPTTTKVKNPDAAPANLKAPTLRTPPSP